MHRDVVMPYTTLIYIIKVIGIYKASTQVLTGQLKHIGYPQKIKPQFMGLIDLLLEQVSEGCTNTWNHFK